LKETGVSEEISVSMNAAAVNAPAVETTVASQPAAKTRTAAWLRSTGIVLAGSALVAVCAHLALPLYFTPVPLSLAPFAVLVLGLLLRPGLAAATLVAYLAEGALGLPVFSPTPALPGWLI
jgi:biotin transport system substrate-specific component